MEEQYTIEKLIFDWVWLAIVGFALFASFCIWFGRQVHSWRQAVAGKNASRKQEFVE